MIFKMVNHATKLPCYKITLTLFLPLLILHWSHLFYHYSLLISHTFFTITHYSQVTPFLPLLIGHTFFTITHYSQVTPFLPLLINHQSHLVCSTCYQCSHMREFRFCHYVLLLRNHGNYHYSNILQLFILFKYFVVVYLIQRLLLKTSYFS